MEVRLQSAVDFNRQLAGSKLKQLAAARAAAAPPALSAPAGGRGGAGTKDTPQATASGAVHHRRGEGAVPPSDSASSATGSRLGGVRSTSPRFAGDSQGLGSQGRGLGGGDELVQPQQQQQQLPKGKAAGCGGSRKRRALVDCDAHVLCDMCNVVQ